MYLAFDKFKEYLNSLDSRLVDHKRAIKSKHEDLQFVRDIVNHMKLRPAGEKERPLLQYGIFFDGEHLFYDDEIVEVNQEEFNHAVLNNVFHFITGSHFTMGFKAFATSADNWYKSHVALYFSHFNISGVKTRYGGSRGQWFKNFHQKEKGYGLIYTPHLHTGNYFYEQYESGKIQLPPGFSIEKTNYFNCPEGVIYIARFNLPNLTSKDGIHFPHNNYQSHPLSHQVALFRNEDGSFQRTNFMNKRAKELRGYKEIMELLGGEIGGDDLDDE